MSTKISHYAKYHFHVNQMAILYQFYVNIAILYQFYVREITTLYHFRVKKTILYHFYERKNYSIRR